jgi:hypothetical protein
MAADASEQVDANLAGVACYARGTPPKTEPSTAGMLARLSRKFGTTRDDQTVASHPPALTRSTYRGGT